MKLDLKRPSFVIVGAWNPAIFSPNWIALNLLDYPEGQELAVTNVLAGDRGPSPIQYIEEVGIFASNQRVEIYLNSLDTIAIDRAESVAAKIIETLPHTPKSSYGINFVFAHENPDADLLDKFSTSENLDQEFEIIQESFNSTLKLDDTILNLVRNPSENAIVFDFNYHHEGIKTEEFREDINGRYQQLLGKSTDILKDYYGLEGYDVDGHALQQTNN